ncbi:MAG: DUF3524 domain-containing protein [Acidobacteriota bacterium]
MARVLLLSPHHGGSHAAFADGLTAHSRHDITLVTLPARFWKWRLRGAALVMAEKVRHLPRPDIVLASDMMNLAEFLCLARLTSTPAVVYMHENQINYPLPGGDRQDAGFGFINIASTLAAQVVVFNSRFHRDTFRAALPGFLGAMPDCRLPAGSVDRLARRTRVLPVGCEIERLAAGAAKRREVDRPHPDGRLILWNHRWEFDKAPEVFFEALARVDDAGARFRLALVGENSQVEPKLFLAARRRYGRRIVRFGWLEDRDAYARLLGEAELVVSTARHENFGISVVEAIACGAWPLLPDRLSYPEIVPARWHEACLYADMDDLVNRLGALLADGPPRSRAPLAAAMQRYDWTALIATYDDLLESACGMDMGTTAGRSDLARSRIGW